MKDFLNDMSPLICLLKPPQIGATEAIIIKTFYCSDKKGWDIIYTLPTVGDVYDMAGGKINRIVAQNPVLNEMVKDHDTVEQKAVGEHIIYYRGTYTSKQAMMVSSDLNVHDEVDASDPSVIEQYETRLQAKANGMRWYFSHPSVPDYGIDKYWQLSDQKHWFITCPHCKEQQYLSFPESIDMEKKLYVCKKCSKPLSNQDRINGKWVAKYSQEWQKANNVVKPFSGYWVSQMMCPWIEAGKIVDDYYNKSPEYFYNYVLGLPYAGGDSKLSQQQLFQNLTGELNQALPDERIVIGVDTGLKIDYVIGNQRLGLYYHGEDTGYSGLDALMGQFKRAIAIIDAGGDMIGARAFFERWRGRVFFCYTNTKVNGNEFCRWNDSEGSVVADREKAIQLVVDEFRTKRVPLQGTEQDWWEYWLDWNNLSRIKVIDPKTNIQRGIKWVRNGRDHKAMATIYWRVGMDKFSEYSATFCEPKKAMPNGMMASI